jgi:hypothetical protein
MMTKLPEFALPSRTKRYSKKLQAVYPDVGFGVGRGKDVARGRQQNYNKIKSLRNCA